MFCSKCGAGIPDGAAFCARCGAAAANGATPLTRSGVIPSNLAGALSYVLGFITAIFFLVVEPYRNDRFVRFHAFQSIFYSVAFIIFWIIYSRFFLLGFFMYSFGFAWAVLNAIWSLITFAAFLFWLFLMYKAYNNERFMVPFIGELAAKQAG